MCNTQPYTKSLSRSKVALFLECPRCFYLDRVLDTGRPPGFPFTLNNAVDKLLKNEFDGYRSRQEVHPLLEAHNLSLTPAQDARLETWRANFKGIRHEYRGYVFSGAIDDLWKDQENRFYVVDYKATGKSQPVIAINEPFHIHYKRQIEFYQWLLRGNGLNVSNTGYFVYATADPERGHFGNQLLFHSALITYEANADWIEPVLDELITCLQSKTIPLASQDCVYCKYIKKIAEAQVK